MIILNTILLVGIFSILIYQVFFRKRSLTFADMRTLRDMARTDVESMFKKSEVFKDFFKINAYSGYKLTEEQIEKIKKEIVSEQVDFKEDHIPNMKP